MFSHIGQLLQFFLLGFTLMALAMSLLLFALAVRVNGAVIEPQTMKTHSRTASISIVVPAYNEEATICHTVESLLLCHYDSFEIVVVNDGSTDRTLNVLKSALDLGDPVNKDPRIHALPVRQLFRSRKDPRVFVIDKINNGGKAEALNVGLSFSANPWLCCVDADTVLAQDALDKIMSIAQRSPAAIAIAGHLRVGNRNLKRRHLVKVQKIEYVRSFILERIGWSTLNGLVIVPGAFSLFKKKAVEEVGGYTPGIQTEDFDLIIKLHRHYMDKRRTYKILYAPEAVAWTEAPSNLSGLIAQRARWYSGLAHVLYNHRGMLFHPSYRLIGLLMMPYLLLFEILWPVVRLFAFAASMSMLTHDWGLGLLLLLTLGFGFFGRWYVAILAVLIDRRRFHYLDPYPFSLKATLIYAAMESTIYTTTLSVIKVLALIKLVMPYTKVVGKWQTLTRLGVDMRPAE